jgi:hypothetical protein
MELENLSFKIKMFIKVNLDKEYLMAKVLTFNLMVLNIKEIFIKVNSMDKEYYIIRIKTYIKEVLLKIKGMELEYIIIKMALFIKGHS